MSSKRPPDVSEDSALPRTPAIGREPASDARLRDSPSMPMTVVTPAVSSPASAVHPGSRLLQTPRPRHRHRSRRWRPIRHRHLLPGRRGPRSLPPLDGPLLLPLAVGVQESTARLGLVTGKGSAPSSASGSRAGCSCAPSCSSRRPTRSTSPRTLHRWAPRCGSWSRCRPPHACCSSPSAWPTPRCLSATTTTPECCDGSRCHCSRTCSSSPW
jgi:hypothetical protein